MGICQKHSPRFIVQTPGDTEWFAAGTSGHRQTLQNTQGKYDTREGRVTLVKSEIRYQSIQTGSDPGFWSGGPAAEF